MANRRWEEGASHPAGDRRTIRLKNGDGISYTLPQRIDPDRVDRLCTVAFRVNRICGPSRIAATDAAGNRIAAFNRDRLAPGEMERIALPRVLLEKAVGDVTLSVEEKEGEPA